MPYYVLEFKESAGGNNLLKKKYLSKRKSAKTAATSVLTKKEFKDIVKLDKFYWVCVRKTGSRTIVQYKVRRIELENPLKVKYNDQGSSKKVEINIKYKNEAKRLGSSKCTSKISKEESKINTSKERCGKRRLSHHNIASIIMGGKRDVIDRVESGINKSDLKFENRYNKKYPSIMTQTAEDKKNIKKLKDEIVGYIRDGRITLKSDLMAKSVKRKSERKLTPRQKAMKIIYNNNHPEGYMAKYHSKPPPPGKSNVGEDVKRQFKTLLRELTVEIGKGNINFDETFDDIEQYSSLEDFDA